MKTTLQLDNRELATVLAALRYWQREGWSSCGHEHEIATDNGELEALEPFEIDTLCERINAGPHPVADALRAIEARIQGVWDDPALMQAGPLGSMTDDILHIIATARKE